MNAQLPAYLTNRRGLALAETLAPLLTTGQPAHISIRQNRFRLVDSAGNEKPVNELHLDVVIVGTNRHMSKIYYSTGYDPENSAPPDCWSDNGLAPSSRAASPQSQTCAVCPKNAWGSDVSKMTGKPTKACNDVMKLAVVVPSDPNNLVYLLRIPPATLKHLGKYVQTIAANMIGERRADPSDVVTRLTFDPQTQGVLNFAPISLIDQQTCALVDGLDHEKQVIPVVGGNDVPIAPGRVQQQVQGLAQPVAPVTTLPPPSPPGMQPAFVTTTDGSGGAGSGTTATFGGSAGGEPPKRRRGRPAAQPTEPAAAPAAQQEPTIPAFLQRNPEPAPAPAAQPQGFGLAQGTEPDAALQKALADAFKLPTG